MNLLLTEVVLLDKHEAHGSEGKWGGKGQNTSTPLITQTVS